MTPFPCKNKKKEEVFRPSLELLSNEDEITSPKGELNPKLEIRHKVHLLAQGCAKQILKCSKLS